MEGYYKRIVDCSRTISVGSRRHVSPTRPECKERDEGGGEEQRVCVSGIYGGLGSLSPSRGERGDSASTELFLGDDTDRGYSDVIEL